MKRFSGWQIILDSDVRTILLTQKFKVYVSVPYGVTPDTSFFTARFWEGSKFFTSITMRGISARC